MKLVFALILSSFLISSNKSKLLSKEQRIVIVNQLGYNVCIVGKFNERRAAKERILNHEGRVKNLLLGSSRIMKFSTKNKKLKTLNLGVSSASIYDLMGLYCIYDKHSEKPAKNIYLGIDPWLFVEKKSDRRWERNYKNYFNHFHDVLKKGSSNIRLPKENDSITVKGISEVYQVEPLLIKSFGDLGPKFKYEALLKWLKFKNNSSYSELKHVNELITSKEFTKILLKDSNMVFTNEGKLLKNEVSKYKLFSWKREKYYQYYNRVRFNRLVLEQEFDLPPSKKIVSDFPTRNNMADAPIRLSNGNIMYPKKHQNRKDEIVDKIVQKKMRTPYLLLPNFKMEKVNTLLFELFVEYMKSNGSNVVLIMLPYHPKMYDMMEQENSKWHFPIELEKYLVDFSKEKGFDLRGSFNPIKCGLIKKQFFDEMHFKESAWLNIINTVGSY